jgi:hypothetical protein
MKEPGLEGRHHNTNGQISQKQGNTKIETLCKTYGDDVARGICSDAMLNTVLEKNGVPSLTSLTKKSEETKI